MSPWKVMNAIFKPGVRPTKEEISKVGSFFFCRFLGSNEHSVGIGNIINLYDKIPIQNQYQLARGLSRQLELHKKVDVIHYQHQKTPKNIEEILQKLELYYKVNRETSLRYLELMASNEKGRIQLDRIMATYAEGQLKD